MSSFLASLISVTIINALCLYLVLWTLRLKDKFNASRFIATLAIVTVAFLIYSNISIYILKLNAMLDGILSIVVFIAIAYFTAKQYLKFDESLSRKFAIYYTIIATLLGIALGIVLTGILFGIVKSFLGS